MTVMVTGAAGLLGRHVVARLLARGDEVIAVDALNRFAMFGDRATRQPIPAVCKHERCLFVESDFADDDVLALMAEDRVDAVVHAAAQTSHPRSIDIPWEDFRVNAIGTVRLLDAIRGMKRRPRLVFISSSKVYGENVVYDFDPPPEYHTRVVPPFWLGGKGTRSEHWYDFDGLGNVRGVNEQCQIGDQTLMTPFGVSKLAGDLYCQQFARCYDMDIVILRPGCFTGPSSNAVIEQNWIPPLVRAMVRGETYTVYGYQGKQVRSILHVADLARAVVMCLDSRANRIGMHAPCLGGPAFCPSCVADGRWNGDVFNVDGGSRMAVSILEAVEIIRELTGRRGELRFAEKRPGDWPWFVGSYRKIEAALGWRPEIDLRQTFVSVCDDEMARIEVTTT